MAKTTLTLPNLGRILLRSEGGGVLRTDTLSRITGVKADVRGDSVALEGEEAAVRQVELALEALSKLSAEAEKGGVERIDFRAAMQFAARGEAERVNEILSTRIVVSPGKVIRPKSINQARYLEAMRRDSVVIGIGPAGTGKTYLAMAMALAQLHAHRIERIILTRPAVEAGERLGFLPGDLEEKVHPYLRPLYDALYDMLGVEGARRLIDREVIEIAPLAFMRGRTLNSAFVILDEAQNTSPEQMKMFLTRLGMESQAVVSGDVTQVDLPRGTGSGLLEARRILEGVEGISFIEFSETDVVRHELVQAILAAYERYEKNREERMGEREKQ